MCTLLVVVVECLWGWKFPRQKTKNFTLVFPIRVDFTHSVCRIVSKNVPNETYVWKTISRCERPTFGNGFAVGKNLLEEKSKRQGHINALWLVDLLTAAFFAFPCTQSSFLQTFPLSQFNLSFLLPPSNNFSFAHRHTVFLLSVTPFCFLYYFTKNSFFSPRMTVTRTKLYVTAQQVPNAHFQTPPLQHYLLLKSSLLFKNNFNWIF